MIPTPEEFYKVHAILSESCQAALKAEATNLLEEAFALHKVNGVLPRLQCVSSVLMTFIIDVLSEKGWVSGKNYVILSQNGREYGLEIRFLEPRRSP